MEQHTKIDDPFITSEVLYLLSYSGIKIRTNTNLNYYILL